MECVFEDADLTTLVLKRLCGDYEEQTGPLVAHGPSRPSPEHRAATLRTILRQTLRSMAMCSRVSKLWKEASKYAFEELLGMVTRAFVAMQVETLYWLASERRDYDGVSVAPRVPREEAVRVLSNTLMGPTILEPLRVCFEVPVPMGRGQGVVPLCNVHNPIAPYDESFSHWSPTHLARHARTAGHWLRVWTSELTWVDPPTHTPEALWLATNRGCAVCGTQCLLQGQRVDLVNAEHHNTGDHETAMSMGQRAPGPTRNPWVGLNGYIEVPWDLPPVNQRLVDESPHHIVSCMATRILPYTHRAHMVTVTFRRTRRDEDPPITTYKLVLQPPVGVDAHQYDQTEHEIMFVNVVNGLESERGKWYRPKLIKALFARRLTAIHDSGLHGYMRSKNMDQGFVDEVCYTNEFKATLPLFPMHGQPAHHCWCAVFDLTKEQFHRLAWTLGITHAEPASAGDHDRVERWRRRTLKHMLAVLSERLPRFDNSVFYRVSEVGHLGGATMPLHSLSGTYTSRILNKIEHARFMMPPYASVPDAIAQNALLLETWPDFEALLNATTDDCMRILSRQSRIDATYDQMIKHFVRLDTVLGPAWRYVTHSGLNHVHSVGVLSLLLIIYTRYTKRSPDPPPVPLLMRHSRTVPGAPRHPDVWLRWFLRAVVKPETQQIDLGTAVWVRDWENIMEVELKNTFIIDASKQEKCSVDYDNVGVHVTFYVLTNLPGTLRPEHMRMSVGIRMSMLEEIRVGMDDTLLELEQGALIGSRAKARDRYLDWPPPKDLSSWHGDVRRTCEELTQQVRGSTGVMGLDLLRRLLDAEWTRMPRNVQGWPTTNTGEHAWVEGWRALHSHCEPGCDWFASTASVLPFCVARGLSKKCACEIRCGAPDT